MKRIIMIEDDQSLSNGIVLALKNVENEIIQCFDIKSAKKDYYKSPLI